MSKDTLRDIIDRHLPKDETIRKESFIKVYEYAISEIEVDIDCWESGIEQLEHDALHSGDIRLREELKVAVALEKIKLDIINKLLNEINEEE